ncbi:glycosyltransferase family A protein [Bacillus cereus group sp. RP43]|uniref:glycosyltransferase family A protein n=1 Tax=Bacillus cereus group sp. RP43 TaxID=3040260 RepID=UPI0033973E87
MNRSNPIDLFEKMNISSNAVMVNQCGYEKQEVLFLQNHKLTYVCSEDIGLSKSRNKAIFNSNDDGIVLLSDDDLVYVDNYSELIQKTFDENPDYDIIRFQVEGINKPFKMYKNKSAKLGYLSSLKTSSVEIAFRIKKIKEANIQFNEQFGAGSVYRMGEENIFLYECLSKGLKIKYEPIKIADLYIGESSWFKGFNKKYFHDRGAIFSALSKRWAGVLILQFAFRHYKKYKSNMTLLQAIRAMFNGHQEYKKTLGEK